MAKVTTTISLDADVKSEGVALLNSFGMDLSTAVAVFLTQTIRERRIPFEIREVPNAETLEALREIEEYERHPEKYKKYDTFKEALEEILSDA